MTRVIVATFPTLADTEDARQDLFRGGATSSDVCELTAGARMSMPHDRGLLAVRVGSGHAPEILTRAIVRTHQGHLVNRMRDSADAMALLQGLPSVHDSFKSPEAILPPVLVEALQESAPGREQPEVEGLPASRTSEVGRS